jgi:hypothetical protein
MSSPTAPPSLGRAFLGRVLRSASSALARLHRSRWGRRQLATALVFAGGLVAGAGGTTLLPALAHPTARLEEARTPGSSAYGLPVGLPGPLPPTRPVKQVRAPSAPPLEVLVPRIGLRSKLVGLRLNLDGTVQVPDSYGVAGWYRDGPAPGDPGAALILGHVDSKSGPGIFFRLRELRKGDAVLVRRADGTTVRFIVDRLATYPKSRFPTAKVYAQTGPPELRLITCTGAFSKGHYLDNLVLFARQLVPAPAQRPVAKKAAAKPVARKPVPKPVPKPAGSRVQTKPEGAMPRGQL